MARWRWGVEKLIALAYVLGTTPGALLAEVSHEDVADAAELKRVQDVRRLPRKERRAGR